MIEIYGKAECTFCDRAKVFCEINNLEYKYLQLDEDFTREEMLMMFPKAKTYPQITRNRIAIGGYDQLVESIK